MAVKLIRRLSRQLSRHFLGLPFEMNSLTPEIERKATLELREDDRKSEAIEALRKLIKEDPEINSRTDDNFLLRFLRARKFDVDRAFILLKNYYDFQEKYAELFKDLLPSKVKDVLNSNFMGFLPFRDTEGRSVFVLKAGLWNPSEFPLDELFRAGLIALEKAIEDEVTQINGTVLILDLKGVGLKHTRHFTPSFAYRLAKLTHECFPARFKAAHIVFEPSIFTFAYAIAKAVLSEKLKKRISVHGTDLDSLHEFIPAAVLPSEYGGDLGQFDGKEWAQKLLNSEEMFIEKQQYGYINRNLSEQESVCKKGLIRSLF